jgi:hypothetical protein
VNIPSPAIEVGSIPDAPAIRALAPALAEAAQAVYDAWEQDEHGLDPELDAGGICHLVAEAFVPILAEAGVEGIATVQAACGENHVFAVALLESGVHVIDISPYVYEHGAAYTWTKRPGVRIRPEDVAVDRVSGPMDIATFEESYREG